MVSAPAIENGFYYDIDPGENNITSADFPKIEAKMAELAAKKEDVVRKKFQKPTLWNSSKAAEKHISVN